MSILSKMAQHKANISASVRDFNSFWFNATRLVVAYFIDDLPDNRLKVSSFPARELHAKI